MIVAVGHTWRNLTGVTEASIPAGERLRATSCESYLHGSDFSVEQRPRLGTATMSGTLAAMLPRTRCLLALVVSGALSSALGQDQGRRIEIEEALQSRYRITVVGGGLMGVHGENSIRKTGGVIVLVHDGLYGGHNRNSLPANAIQQGKSEVFSGDKEVALAPGEKFYVTAAHVGSDVVMLGLLSARMIPGAKKNAQVWCTVNFFYSKDTLEQGDIGKVFSVIDQWLLPEGATTPVSPSTPPPAPAVALTPAPLKTQVELKPGMTREQIVNALGAPLQDTAFADRRWLTYPGITVTLDQGKLTSVERNAQALVPVKISSDPGGADVFLDGSFVSSTPAVLRLQAGTYKVAVKMSGYTNWEREVKILPGAEVTLDARLSK